VPDEARIDPLPWLMAHNRAMTRVAGRHFTEPLTSSRRFFSYWASFAASSANMAAVPGILVW